LRFAALRNVSKATLTWARPPNARGRPISLAKAAAISLSLAVGFRPSTS
jgi:hypothetical protein